MKKLTALVLICASSLLVLASFATAGQTMQPKTIKFSAALNIGQEVPHPQGTKVGASGRFTATLTGTTLTWTLSFTHLSGPASAAHIHNGVRGTSGPVIVPLCGPCNSPATGTATVTHAQISALIAGKTYVNVHTAQNPNGEIRGQISHAR
jgi:hypothetical protein